MFKFNKAKPIEFPFKGVEVKMSIPDYKIGKDIKLSTFDMIPNVSFTIKVSKSHTTNNKILKVIYDALELTETYPLYVSRSLILKLIEHNSDSTQCHPTTFRNFFNMLFKEPSSNGLILEPAYKFVGCSVDEAHEEIGAYNLKFKNEVEKNETVLFHNM